MSIEQGFAIRRNGTCLAGIEIPCGATGFNGMVGCCPNGLACPQAYNIDCCPSGKNCTMTIVQTPRCSNSSWDLFDNGGYFCCEHGLAAYNNLGTNICASPGSSPTGILLELIKAGESKRFPDMWLLQCTDKNFQLQHHLRPLRPALSPRPLARPLLRRLRQRPQHLHNNHHKTLGHRLAPSPGVS
jgi:hypothetical protein